MAHRVALIGSGNWGSAIARIIGANARRFPQLFEPTIKMYVYPEEVEYNGSKRWLHDVINEVHENVKYLPGVKLPDNIIATSDVRDSMTDASLLVFVTPHQFVPSIVDKARGAFNPRRARAISLIKGTIWDEPSQELRLVSRFLSQQLGGVRCSVLMGANVANEVAQDVFCEATIGAASNSDGLLWKQLFHLPTFQVNVVADVVTVELCGSLKNIVAVAAGFVDGLKLGGNTKAAIMRIGLCEMRSFTRQFWGTDNPLTYFESCGVADLFTTCTGGRNVRVAAEYARTGKSFDVLEKEMLNGQKLQGTLTAEEVYKVLTRSKATASYPLFVATYRVVYEKLPVEQFIDTIMNAGVCDVHAAGVGTSQTTPARRSSSTRRPSSSL